MPFDFASAIHLKDDHIQCNGLLPVGYVLKAFAGAGSEVGERAKQIPHEIGSIPNPVAFERGKDIYGDARLVKKNGKDEVYLPLAFRPFLATLQMQINREVSIIGEEAFRQRYLTFKVSRHRTKPGFSHQPHFPDFHDHKSNGPSSYYSAANQSGTQFRNGTAADRAVWRFEEEDSHNSPKTSRRRTFMVTVVYDKCPDPRGEFGMYKRPIHDGTPEKALEWQHAAEKVVARSYPKEAQARDIQRWLAADSALKR